jgi:hypothetical protein
MKIVSTCRIAGHGDAIITDEVFTPGGFAAATKKKTLCVAIKDGSLELRIISVEAVLGEGGHESLGIVVPFFTDEVTRDRLVNREIQLS